MKRNYVEVEMAWDENEPSVLDLRITHVKGKQLTIQTVVDAVSDALLMQWGESYKSDQKDS